MLTRIPQGKFVLEKFPGRYPDGTRDDKYIVTLIGKNSRWWLDSTARDKVEALKHFWRYIGAE